MTKIHNVISEIRVSYVEIMKTLFILFILFSQLLFFMAESLYIANLSQIAPKKCIFDTTADICCKRCYLALKFTKQKFLYILLPSLFSILTVFFFTNFLSIYRTLQNIAFFVKKNHDKKRFSAINQSVIFTRH